MGLDQIPGDGQPEPGAGGTLALHESLEDAWQELGRDPGAGVTDLDQEDIVQSPRDDADRAARRRVPDGVMARRCEQVVNGAWRRCGGQASKRRKMATAFWPPNPKPLIIAVSTRAWRATFGT